MRGLFSLPNEKGDFVTSVGVGTKVQVLSKGSNYSFVKVGSKYGYIQSSFLVDIMYQAKSFLPDCKLFGAGECKKISANHVKIYDGGYEFMDYRVEDGMYYATLDSQFAIPFPVYKGTQMQLEIAGGYFDAKVTNVGFQGGTISDDSFCKKPGRSAGDFDTFSSSIQS